VSELTAALRDAVLIRAARRCEFCQLAQAGQEAAFHIDHIVPRAADCSTTEHNLALACVSCSLHKAAKQTGIDPESGQQSALYNPRTQRWSEHFRWDGELAIGVTAIGRATISALRMNRPLILAIRREEFIRGRHPHP
jgi:hypothetical protein